MINEDGDRFGIKVLRCIYMANIHAGFNDLFFVLIALMLQEIFDNSEL